MLDGAISLGRDTELEVTNGTVGTALGGDSVNVSLPGGIGTAQISISDGTFDGGVQISGRGSLTISDGSFGAGLDDSLNLSTPLGLASATINGGDFAGGVDAGRNALVFIAGGTFGDDLIGQSISARAPGFLDAVVNVAGGTFDGGVNAAENAEIEIIGGTYGTDISGNSVSVRAPGATAGVHITGGTFDGGVRAAEGGRARLDGGSFGAGGLDAHSIDASGFGLDDAIVEVFGGTYAGEIHAGDDSIIYVYGSSLDISGGMLTGTLADGTPINTPASTEGDGIIALRGLIDIPVAPPGLDLLKMRGGRMGPIDPDGPGPVEALDIDMQGVATRRLRLWCRSHPARSHRHDPATNRSGNQSRLGRHSKTRFPSSWSRSTW